MKVIMLGDVDVLEAGSEEVTTVRGVLVECSVQELRRINVALYDEVVVVRVAEIDALRAQVAALEAAVRAHIAKLEAAGGAT